MTSIDLYDELVKNINTGQLQSQRQSNISQNRLAVDEFQILIKTCRGLLQNIRQNNEDVIKYKDKLAFNTRPQKQNIYSAKIKKCCEENYNSISEMRQKIIQAGKIVEKTKQQFPNQPETFSKIFRKQHLAQEINKVLNETLIIEKLIDKFLIETNLKRIRIVLPDITQQQATKLAKESNGFQKVLTQKTMGKASLRLLYANQDILAKARGIAQLQMAVSENLRLMKQVSLLVHQQGQMIDNILINVAQAKDYIGKAEKNLQIQKQKHKSSKKRICCIIFVGLIILALIITPIVLNIVNRNQTEQQVR